MVRNRRLGVLAGTFVLALMAWGLTANLRPAYPDEARGVFSPEPTSIRCGSVVNPEEPVSPGLLDPERYEGTDRGLAVTASEAFEDACEDARSKRLLLTVGLGGAALVLIALISMRRRSLSESQRIPEDRVTADAT